MHFVEGGGQTALLVLLSHVRSSGTSRLSSNLSELLLRQSLTPRTFLTRTAHLTRISDRSECCPRLVVKIACRAAAGGLGSCRKTKAGAPGQRKKTAAWLQQLHLHDTHHPPLANPSHIARLPRDIACIISNHRGHDRTRVSFAGGPAIEPPGARPSTPAPTLLPAHRAHDRHRPAHRIQRSRHNRGCSGVFEGARRARGPRQGRAVLIGEVAD